MVEVTPGTLAQAGKSRARRSRFIRLLCPVFMGINLQGRASKLHCAWEASPLNPVAAGAAATRGGESEATLPPVRLAHAVLLAVATIGLMSAAPSAPTAGQKARLFRQLRLQRRGRLRHRGA